MWVVHIELDAAARAYFQALPADWIPAAYRPRLARKHHAQAIVQSLAGIWLLERALLRAGHEDVTIADIDIDAHGRPQLPAGPVFSISHSDQHAACAIAEVDSDATHIGIDIEQPRPMAPARMARLLSSDDERAAVTRQPALFFDYWCAREATVKATGRVGLKRMRQTQIRDGSAWLDKQRWTLHPLKLTPGLTACLASDASPTTPIHVRQQTIAAGQRQ